MSQRYMIEISSEKAQKLERISKFMGISIESILAETTPPLYPQSDLDSQLAHVAGYTDLQLWVIVETPVVSDEEWAEREPILQRAKQGTYSDEDKKYLDEFSELYNKRVLLRTEALVALQERGYDVKSYLKENAPKK
jgi:hypothetical protein